MDEIRKRTFLFFCIVICIPFVFLFAVDDLKNHRTYEGFFILSVLTVFVFNLFALRYVRHIKNIYRFSGVLVLALLGFELAIGGGDGHAFLWFYFFPLAAFYLLGKKEGILWVSLSIFLSVCILFHPIVYAYNPGIILRFLITYSVVSLLSFGLEFSRNRYYKQLIGEKLMLEDALNEVKTLRGLLPICSFCKRIRDDKGYWNQIESYIDKHSEVQFSHSICPSCSEKHYAEFVGREDKRMKGSRESK